MIKFENQEYNTIRDIADEFGVSDTTIKYWIASGVIQKPPVVQIGKQAIRVFPDSYVAKARTDLLDHYSVDVPSSPIRSYPGSSDFSVLLNWHLNNGTRPSRRESKSQVWSDFEFSQHVNASMGTIRRWRKGETLTRDIAKIEQALFAGTGEHDLWLADFRLAYAKAVNSKNGPPPVSVLPTSEPLALQFTSENQGPVDLLLQESNGETFAANRANLDDYEEIRVKTAELSAMGSNRLGRAAQAVQRFSQLSNNLTQVRPKIFWSRLNTLRLILEDHDNAIESTTPLEFDERKLDTMVASQLRDLVQTLNVFSFSNSILLELDSVRSGPTEAAEAKIELARLQPIVKDALSDNSLTTSIVREAIEEQSSTISITQETLHASQARRFSALSMRNLIMAFLRKAYTPIIQVYKSIAAEGSNATRGARDGAYRTIGAAIVTGAGTEAIGLTDYSIKFLVFVRNHANQLIEYVSSVFKNQVLVDIVNWIVKFGSQI